MSFILDALKKSESDRQRQTGPSLFEVKVAPPRRALPVWAVAIAVLLGINIVVISWMLLRHPAAQQTAAPSSAPIAAQPAPSSTATLSAAPAARSLSEPAVSGPAVSGPAVSAPAVSGSAPSGSGISGPAPSRSSSDALAQAAADAPDASRSARAQRPAQAPAASAAGRNTVAPPSDNPGDDEPAVQPAAGSEAAGSAAEDLPLYQQIVSSAGLPELHLDLHVFADRPRDRFVMINMHRLGEGDSLPSGVQVDAIRPDGVVLSYHGTRFLLPRS
jgi:general secretion pathway protein B